MALNLTTIRSAITTAITAGITDATMTGYLLSPIPSGASFEIDFPPDGLAYDAAFRTGAELDIVVRGIVNFGEPDESQARLDGWLDNSGGQGVKQLIETSAVKSSAGVSDLRVTRATGHRRLQVPGENSTLLCAEWTVSILI